MMTFMIVVLPVPGPPVITDTPLVTAIFTASLCSSSSSISVSSSISLTAISTASLSASTAVLRSMSIRADEASL